MLYLQLFWSFFQIGLFSIGGGYAALPLIQNQIVTIHGWLSMAEFTDVITISQMTPGPVAINSATFVGLRLGGVFGAVSATMGCVLPSSAIVLTLAFLYYRYRNLTVMKGIFSGVRPAVTAMIASSGLSILVLALWQGAAPSLDPRQLDWIAGGLFAAGLLILLKWKVNPIWIMAGSGILGLLLYLAFI